MTDDELRAVYQDGRFRDRIDALRGVAAAAWAEGEEYGALSISEGRVYDNPYRVSPEGTA